MEIKEGDIIEGHFWPEPVEVKKVEKLGDFIHIIGATLQSGVHIDQLIPISEVDKIQQKSYTKDFTAPADEVFLALEGQRYRYASLFDPLLAMNVSKIDPLPFQIEAVYGYILKLPHIRYLIADDPGAGKTIMAGLIIKELKLRGIIKKVLIVVPGHLKDQWKRELKDKFQEIFEVIDRSRMDASYGDNPWTRETQVITSMDYAKREEVLPSLSSSEWDLVVVDEAHKFTAYRYGETKIDKSQRYRLGETLSKISEHLLFLTATPHKGDPENYRLFLDLLEPGFFAQTELLNESIKNRDNPLFIRRLKEDMKDFNGRPIFKPRHPITLKFNLSDKEKDLYNSLSRYVVTEYNKAVNDNGRRNIAFALLILQRRMASSTFALLQSLIRRKNRLSEFLGVAEIPLVPLKTINIEDYEESEESQRWEAEKEWETISFAENKEELKREIATIDRLIQSAEEIIAEETEKKLTELKKSIAEGFKKIKETGGNEKILIFTESRDTMDYLFKKIKAWGYNVNFIHGGMNLIERVEAEKIFKNETQIMVATEAAGEGINLQFCNIMINYDIPWNPNRLEQRMGRIHRYGQQYEVYIYNLVAQDTREGEVLAKLFDKLEEIRRAMGNEKVFDIIGDAFGDKNLYQLICDAAANIRSSKEIAQEIDFPVDEEYISRVKDALGESLATRYIDYTRISEMAEKAKEYKLIPEYIEEFFKKGIAKAGGNYRISEDNFISIDTVPYELRRIGKEPDMENKYGPINRSYKKITFDKDVSFNDPYSEFVSFGHPLFESLLEWIERSFSSGLRRGALFTDPSGRYNGILLFYEGEIKDGKGTVAGKKLLALLDDGKKLVPVNPAILWDIVPSTNKQPISIEIDESKAKIFVIDILNNYKEEILITRRQQAEIKEKYGVSSLKYLISKIDAELVELYIRRDKGEKVELPISNKQERQNDYKKALDNLKKEINYETNLTLTMPKLVGCVYLQSKTEDGLKEDENIEKIGMEIAMEYEKSKGRVPEDVSKENIGFDIRSKGSI